MSFPVEHSQGDLDCEQIEKTHNIVYLATRAAYTFVFAVPKNTATPAGGARTFLQVRFTDREPPQSVKLSPEVLEDFYNSLSQLMEYIRTERANDRRRAGDQAIGCLFPPGVLEGSGQPRASDEERCSL
jgi:hypothetical protein